MLRAKTLLLVLLLASPGLAQRMASAGELATLTSLITAALSNDTRLDVLSSSDVREVMAFEGDKQALGCADESSCLAEVAGAMGARLVVFSQLGGLGNQRILTLNLFDAHAGRAQARVVIKAASVEGLGEQLDDAVKRLTASVTESGEGPTKMVVLEVKAAAAGDQATADPSIEEPEASGTPWLLVGGGVVAGAGVLTVATGGVLVAIAAQQDGDAAKASTQREAEQTLEARDGLAVGAYAAWAVGAALVIVGGVVAVAGLMVGGE
jgi:hypothetical protein